MRLYLLHTAHKYILAVKCLDFHQNKTIWRCNAAVSREWLSASLAGGKNVFLHSPTVSFTTPHLLWETEWGLFIIYGRLHDRECVSQICDGLFINLMNVWLFSFLFNYITAFSTTMGNWGRKAVKRGIAHIAGIPLSSFVVRGEVFLVSQQVIEQLGANFNKPSFSTLALKYKTKRCETVWFNSMSKSKQSSTDVTCILKTFRFCY